jgi:hypothetical protein
VAGFRNVVLPLGVAAAVVAALSPLPLWQLGGSTTAPATAGFITPVPVVPLGGGLPVSQGGFVSVVTALSLGGNAAAQPTTQKVAGIGMGMGFMGLRPVGTRKRT